MQKLSTVVLALGLIAACPAFASAQNPNTPRAAAGLTPADSAAVLLHAARELRNRDEPEAARAVLRLIMQRFAGTPSADQARIDLGLVETEEFVSSGRVELQVWGALYGLWVGLAIPGAAGADGSEAYGIGLLLGGPAGFLAASSYTKSHPLTTGQARAITLGGTWGTWQGWGWANVANLGEGFTCTGDVCFSDDSNAKLWAALAGGGVGIVTGALIARRPISPGLATTANFGALWGTWFGLAAGGMADLENDDLLALTLVGGSAGLASSALLGRGWNLTRSRARLISIAGVLGGLVGGGIDLIAQPDDATVALGIPLATSIAGLVIGAKSTQNRNGSAPRDDAGGDGPTSADAGNDSDASSLFSIRDGAFHVGLPIPTPDRMLVSDGRGDRRALTNRVTLFRMRF